MLRYVKVTAIRQNKEEQLACLKVKGNIFYISVFCKGETKKL